MSIPDVKNDAAPKWASNSQRAFIMGKAIDALTGRAARHKTQTNIFGGNASLKKSSLGVCVAKRMGSVVLYVSWADCTAVSQPRSRAIL